MFTRCSRARQGTESELPDLGALAMERRGEAQKELHSSTQPRVKVQQIWGPMKKEQDTADLKLHGFTAREISSKSKPSLGKIRHCVRRWRFRVVLAGVGIVGLASAVVSAGLYTRALATNSAGGPDSVGKGQVGKLIEQHQTDKNGSKEITLPALPFSPQAPPSESPPLHAVPPQLLSPHPSNLPLRHPPVSPPQISSLLTATSLLPLPPPQSLPPTSSLPPIQLLLPFPQPAPPTQPPTLPPPPMSSLLTATSCPSLLPTRPPTLSLQPMQLQLPCRQPAPPTQPPSVPPPPVSSLLMARSFLPLPPLPSLPQTSSVQLVQLQQFFPKPAPPTQPPTWSPPPPPTPSPPPPSPGLPPALWTALQNRICYVGHGAEPVGVKNALTLSKCKQRCLDHPVCSAIEWPQNAIYGTCYLRRLTSLSHCQFSSIYDLHFLPKPPSPQPPPPKKDITRLHVAGHNNKLPLHTSEP
mmetsp:Transcript_71463/g.118772  ORF Transcript_71463/g.118772 Transcript_71463/m.118772 type:complete len:469 (+) Transcript_71463:116-1522(+)